MEMAQGALISSLALLTANLRGIFTLLIARLLGKAALGTFALAYSILDLFLQVGTFGLDVGSTPLVAQRQTAGDFSGSASLLRGAVRAGLLLSSATALLGIAAVQLFGTRLGLSPGLVQATSVLLLAMPGIVLYRVSNGVSRGMKVVRHEIYSRGLVETFGTIAILLGAVALGLTQMAPIAAVILGAAAGGLVAYHLARGLFPPAAGKHPAEPVTGVLLRFGAPISLYSLLNIAILRMDLVLLGLWVNRAPGVTIESIGIYAAAVEIAGGLRKINQAFTPMFTTIVAAQSVAAGHDEMAATFARLSRWVLALVLPVVAVLNLSGGVLLRIFGPGFEAGRPWLELLAIASGINTVVALAETVILVRHPMMNLLNSGLAALLGIGLSLWLIPRYGPLGAALGMIVPYGLKGCLRFAQLRWVYGWKGLWRALLRPLGVTALALAPTVALRLVWTSWAGEVTSGLAFLGLYLLAWRLVGLEDTDREIFRQLRDRFTRRWRRA